MGVVYRDSTGSDLWRLYRHYNGRLGDVYIGNVTGRLGASIVTVSVSGWVCPYMQYDEQF
jgi:hypothetical protein